MPQITIDIDEDVKKIINKRAKKNLMTLREQIEDILKTELYEFITAKQYSLYSWVKPSLIFVRNGYYAQSAVVTSRKDKKN